MELLNVELEQESILQTALELTTGTGLSDEVKQALLDCFAHVVWVDEHGQDYYDALYDALYPPANLRYISCVYTQSGTVYDTDSLDDLKPNLVVTAHYDDSSTEVVTTYVLTGTLVSGTSTITVTYGEKTTSFNVVVTHATTQFSITNNLTNCTNSNTDSVINEQTTYTGTLTALAGFEMSAVTVTMGNVDITSTAYNSGTGVISIASVTGNIVITATAVTQKILGYIGEGLLMLLDGNANGTGGSHESTITTLVDQTGNGYDWVAKTGTVTADTNALVFGGSSCLKSESTWESTVLTTPKAIEIVVDVTSPSTTSCAICGLSQSQSDANNTSLGTIGIKSSNLLHRTGSTYGCIPISSGRHTYSFVDDNGTWKSYKDGELVTNGSTTITWKSGHHRFGCFVGSGGTNESYFFNGKIYSYRYYTESLSASDVASNYANDVTRFGS